MYSPMRRLKLCLLYAVILTCDTQEFPDQDPFSMTFPIKSGVTPPSLPCGRVTVSNDIWKSQPSATYTCSYPYTLVRSDIVCASDSGATSDAPTCQHYCGQPPVDLNTKIICRGVNQTSRTPWATYECIEGYQAYYGERNHTVSCDPKTLRWEKLNMHCEAIQIPAVNTITLNTLPAPHYVSNPRILLDQNAETHMELPTSYLARPATFTIPFRSPLQVYDIVITASGPVTDENEVSCNQYVGNQSKTIDGEECQFWKEITVNGISFSNADLFPFDTTVPFNYCRMPKVSYNENSQRSAPWCFTDLNGKSWNFCDIKFCALLSVNVTLFDETEVVSMKKIRDKTVTEFRLGKTFHWDPKGGPWTGTGLNISLSVTGKTSVNIHGIEIYGRPYTEICPGPPTHGLGYRLVHSIGEFPPVCKEGTEAEYECQTGWYYNRGNNTSVCEKGGSWSQLTLECFDDPALVVKSLMEECKADVLVNHRRPYSLVKSSDANYILFDTCSDVQDQNIFPEIISPINTDPELECVEDIGSYRGQLNYTVNGKICDQWTDIKPSGIFPSGETYQEASNYCRYLDERLGNSLWCMVDGNRTKCAISKCEDICVVPWAPKGTEYKGLLDFEDETNSLLSCRLWSTPVGQEDCPFHQDFLFPDNSSDHNYCRNPDRRESGPWCQVDNCTDDGCRLQQRSCHVPACPTTSSLLSWSINLNKDVEVTWFDDSSLSECWIYDLNGDSHRYTKKDNLAQNMMDIKDSGMTSRTVLCHDNIHWYRHRVYYDDITSVSDQINPTDSSKRKFYIITTIQPTQSLGLNKQCPCRCSHLQEKKSWNESHSFDKYTKAIRQSLYVDKSALSKFVRSKISINDDRPISKTIGATVSFIAIFFVIGIIVVSDVARMLAFLTRIRYKKITDDEQKTPSEENVADVDRKEK